MSKPLDLVVHGATGFTGSLVAEYLAQQYGPSSGLRWGLSGRNPDRLAAVRESIGAAADLPLLRADSGDEASLAALMEQTALVISTVGPYQDYGSPLVAACARAGVDYVDLCGEPLWMRRMIDEHEASARESGARIVFSCGFDSVPFDLGVFDLQRRFEARHGNAASQVKGRVRRMKGTFSGGTAASMQSTMALAEADPVLKDLLRNHFALTPGFEGPRQPNGQKPLLDDDFGVWLAPFVMAIINTRNIHRSNFLLGHRWGKDFSYNEMLMTGPGEKGEAMAQRIASDQSIADKDGPKPGEGPSRAEQDAGFFDLVFQGQDAGGKRLRVSVKGDRDPGYGATSRMIAETAMALRDQAANRQGGIWTPASALGSTLVDRLSRLEILRFTEEPI